jgi:hypothetical protein
VLVSLSTESWSVTSSSKAETVVVVVVVVVPPAIGDGAIDFAAASPWRMSLEPIITLIPCRTSCWEIAKPIPLFPPVTKATFFDWLVDI